MDETIGLEAMLDNAVETVPGKFKQAVSKWGTGVAMRKKEYGLWHDISWNEYHDNVIAVACALISMGLEHADCAAIIGDNCPEWVFADVGIQCCGAAATGVSGRLPRAASKRATVSAISPDWWAGTIAWRSTRILRPA